MVEAAYLPSGNFILDVKSLLEKKSIPVMQSPY